MFHISVFPETDEELLRNGKRPSHCWQLKLHLKCIVKQFAYTPTQTYPDSSFSARAAREMELKTRMSGLNKKKAGTFHTTG